MVRNEVEDAKIELVRGRKGFEEDLAKARAQAVEDFENSNEYRTLLR